MLRVGETVRLAIIDANHVSFGVIFRNLNLKCRVYLGQNCDMSTCWQEVIAQSQTEPQMLVQWLFTNAWTTQKLQNSF